MHPARLSFKGTECPQSLSDGTEEKITLPTPSAAFFEFRPEPVDAFGACARYPAETGAKKFVFFFTFQAEAEGVPV
jgi:hypothetical protein